jgi:hypothetical protein
VLVTRSLAIVPAILVAVFSAQNMDKLDQLLNILQSVQLPFAVWRRWPRDRVVAFLIYVGFAHVQSFAKSYVGVKRKPGLA